MLGRQFRTGASQYDSASKIRHISWLFLHLSPWRQNPATKSAHKVVIDRLVRNDGWSVDAIIFGIFKTRKANSRLDS